MGEEKSPPASTAIVEDDGAKPSLMPFFRLFTYATTGDRVLIGVSILSAFGAGTVTPLMNVVFGQLISSFNAYGSAPGSPSASSQFLDLQKERALYFTYFFLVKFCLDCIAMFCMRKAGLRISAALRVAYLKALFSLPINQVDKMPPGSATNTLTTATTTIQMAISDKLALAMQGTAIFVGCVVTAFIYSWQLSLAGISCYFAVGIFYAVVTAPFMAKLQRVMDSNRGAAGVAGEVFKSIRTIKSLCAERAMMARHAEWVDESKKHGLNLNLLMGLLAAPLPFATFSNMALVFWLAMKLFIQGDISDISHLVTSFFAMVAAPASLALVTVHLAAVQGAAVASVECFRIIDAPKRSDDGRRAPLVDSAADIRFEDIHFTYPARPGTKVLNGVSMNIPAGKVTALVGPSGCGKSTVVALLERWYDLSDENEKLKLPKEDASHMMPSEKMALNKLERVRMKQETKDQTKSARCLALLRKLVRAVRAQSKAADPRTDIEAGDVIDVMPPGGEPVLQNSGKIYLGTHSIEDLDRKWLRSQIGLVQQEPYFFNETIYVNIAMGLVGTPHESVTEEEKRALVEDACKEAFAHEFVRHLPRGYDTMVGEGGLNLSGGQKQRLAIARSIVKKPSILILDEATSSIDVRAEKIVQEALDRASRGRTTITIAHRLRTIREAHNIVVFRDGCIAEQGTHDELLELKEGVYTGLVHAQRLELGSGQPAEDARMFEIPEHNLGFLEPFSTTMADTKKMAGEMGSKESETKLPGCFRALGLLMYEQRQYWPTYAVILACGCISGSATAAQSYLISNFYTLFMEATDDVLGRASFWAGMFMVMAAATGSAAFAIGYFGSRLSAQMAATYRQQYFASIVGKPVPWFDQAGHSSGALADRVANDATQLQQVLGPNLALPVSCVFTALSTVALAFAYGWKLAAVLSAALLPVILGTAAGRLRLELRMDKLNQDVYAESSIFVAEAVGALRSVTAFTLEEAIAARYRALLHRQVGRASGVARFAVLLFALADSVPLLGLALSAYYGSSLVASGEYGLSQFYVIDMCVIFGSQAAGQLLALGANGAQAAAAANRILSLRGDSEAPGPQPRRPGPRNGGGGGGRAPAGLGASVEFRNVGFRYAGRSVPVYRGLSFSVPAGGHVALVGPSGSGKTTAVNLLARFYAPSSGSILADGRPLESEPLASHRHGLALVGQEAALFSGTLRENLALGLPWTPPDREIERACAAAEIHGFVAGLGGGYGTRLAPGGAGLSGGQKQRLCLARALLRRPRLLVLDEATSSLDAASEALVRAAVERAAAGGMSVLVVAHRLATVQGAAKIVVLGEGGRVVEEGSHADLVRRRGVYWGMCRAQALDR